MPGGLYQAFFLALPVLHRQAGRMSGKGESGLGTIEEAGAGDSAAIAAIHTESWREVYRGTWRN